jgi:aminoglycoside phosphotransferase (APT) family kinase protein
MDERVREVVSSHGARLLSVTPLHGGACQENYRVELLIGDTPTTLALRSDAKTSLAESIPRRVEYAVIDAAVAAGVKTPRARWLTRDLLRAGADAYFLDWVFGEAIGRRVVRNPELEGARARLPNELAQTLATIHSITPETHTLPLKSATARPAEAAVAALYRMMESLPSVYPAVEFSLSWLSDRIPVEREVVLTHGDFRTGNFMVTPDGLAAVLDWEFAHWGSVYEDLAWISVRDWRFGRLGLPIGGFSKRAAFYQAYESSTGRQLDPNALLWWEIMGNVRWALGSVNQGERYLSGEETDLELIAIARRSVEMEFEALRLIRAGRLD